MNSSPFQPDAEQTETLVSRAVDGTLSDTQWQQLEAIASKQPAMWRDLCLAHRDALSLRAAVANESHGAAAATLRVQEQEMSEEEVGNSEGAVHSRWLARRAWMGWAAAAVFGIVAAVQFSQRAGSTPILLTSGNRGAGSQLGGVQENTAGIGSVIESQLSSALRSLSPQDLLTQYVHNGREDGTVYGVLPERVVLSTEPLLDGAGYEVVYLRQIVERQRVRDFYGISHDEQGNAFPVRVSPGVPFVPATPAKATQPQRSRTQSAL